MLTDIEQLNEEFQVIDENVIDTTNRSAQAGDQLQKASRSAYKSLGLKIAGVTGAIGAGIGGIFGLLPGAVIGGGGGAAVGAAIGKGIEKQGIKQIDKLEFERADTK